MTQVEVTQADRDAAASVAMQFASYSHHWLRELRTGIRDYDAVVQAFAAHRLAEQERCRLVLWKLADDLAHEPRAEFEDHQQFNAGKEHGVRAAMSAIRTGQNP